MNFRPDGSLAERRHCNPDGSEWTSIFQYDADRLTALRNDNGKSFASLNIYEYDEVGRLARVIGRLANGIDHTVESYQYTPDGRKQKTIHFDVANQRPDTHYAWGVEGTDSCYSAPGAATLKTLFNEREQPTALLFYDAAENILSRVELSYDADANLIEEAQTNSADMLPEAVSAAMNPVQLEAVRAMFGAVEPIRRIHRYDENGRRIESRSRMGMLGEDTKTMVYNHLGDQIAEVFRYETRDYGIDDKGQLTDAPIRESMSRSEARFLYEYDPEGNWVLKTVEGRGAEDQPFTQSSVERRSIEYFDLSQAGEDAARGTEAVRDDGNAPSVSKYA